jgi:3-deoxy-7-phosphoheptulonate synthase
MNVSILDKLRLVSRKARPANTIIHIDNVKVGGKRVIVIAGPCAVESREQLIETAHFLKRVGVSMLRGGAFKPRTSPYSFQGLGEQGLALLAEVRDQTGLPIVTEVMSPTDVRLAATYADVLQIGARNMQNFPLLREVGRVRKPILLKRGLAARVEEWLAAAEYVLCQGNSQVILCERGIRTFETMTRFTLDLSSVSLVKALSHLPVIVDPSHATGRRDLVRPMARAAIAAGADGVMVEVHPTPAQALSDGSQSLTFDQFETLMRELGQVAQAVGRRL